MSRRALAALLIAFAITRLAGAWLADHPAQYVRWGHGSVTGDVFIYEQWAAFLLDKDVAAYKGVGIEYPPGSLPFLALPELLRRLPPPDGTYQTAFILLMVLVDAAGFAAVLLAARRWGSALGAWLWVLAVPLLGPIVYARLDLVPAVATQWAMAAAAGGAWFSVGAWLGFGALAKLYPALLLPGAFLAARDRRHFVAGALLLLVTPMLAFVTSLRAVWTSVMGYHFERGLQLESLWANGLLIARKFGADVAVSFDHGAFHMQSPLAAPLERISSLLSLAALGAGVWLVYRAVPRGDGARLASALFATLSLVMALGSVFSPQFVVWLIALGAAAASARHCPIRGPVLALFPVAVLTQALFPFLYEWIIPGRALALGVLTARNLLVLAIGVWAFVRVLVSAPARSAVPAPRTPAEANA